jgi:Holliday junction resolvase RusA-like endonuclease
MSQRLQELVDSALAATFEVIGDPIPQGSMRAFARRGGGRPILTADNVRTRPWKDAVAWHAAQARKFTATEPVAVELRFTLRRPKGHSLKGGNLRKGAPAYHGTKPDIDKLTRAVLDALVEAQVLADDSLVAVLRVAKGYPMYPDQPAGVAVTVRVL